MEALNGCTGVARQQDGTGFRNINRATGTIDGKGSHTLRFDYRVHSKQCAYAAARTGSTNGLESETFENERNKFAVEAAAGHDGDSTIAEEVRRRHATAMPERRDGGRIWQSRRIGDITLFATNRKAESHPDELKDESSEPVDEK